MSVVRVFNRQRGHRVDSKRLAALATRAFPHALAVRTRPDVPLAGLDLVEVSIVSDGAIARVHGDFFDDPTPTDVITFDHGEILVSADTALENSARFDTSQEDELALYIIHGLLHLAGWEDDENEETVAMSMHQDAILQKVL